MRKVGLVRQIERDRADIVHGRVDIDHRAVSLFQFQRQPGYPTGNIRPQCTRCVLIALRPFGQVRNHATASTNNCIRMSSAHASGACPCTGTSGGTWKHLSIFNHHAVVFCIHFNCREDLPCKRASDAASMASEPLPPPTSQTILSS